jgi:ribosome-associated heat shock protein Hsp15
VSEETIRLDKWLWYARFFKTRTLAGKVALSGRTRLNGARISKASQQVRAGDVLTFVQAKEVRVVRVLAIGERRGPASEAQALYEDVALS